MNGVSKEHSALVKLGDRFSGRLTIAAILIVLFGLGFAFGRAYKDYSNPNQKEFNWSARGMSDLHNCYAYAKTFRYGLSPYEVQQREDLRASRPSAPFSPSIFFLLWPLTYLGVSSAVVVFSLINVAMLGLLAWMTGRFSGVSLKLHWWLAIFGFILMARSGHITLYTGYFTAVLVIGTLLAFEFGDRKPLLAGIGVLLASAKPTYIIPLLILLLYRKNYKAALWGTALSGAVALGGVCWLAAESSFTDVVSSVVSGQDAFADDPTEFPINTWTRIDLLGMFAKAVDWVPGNKEYLGSMFVLLVLPGLAIRRAVTFERHQGAMGLSAAIAMLALLVTLYHHSYDCLLVVPTGLSLLLFGNKTMPRVPRITQLIVVALLTFPSVNYLSTLTFRTKMDLDRYGVVWQSITMLNGFCLTLSMLILMYYAWSRSVREAQTEGDLLTPAATK